MLDLSENELEQVEKLVARMSTRSVQHAPALSKTEREWPHAPLHKLQAGGTYIVTSATYQKQHFFRGKARLDYLEQQLLELARVHGWQLEAWAVFSNHYHFVAQSPIEGNQLATFTKLLHGKTAKYVNEADGVNDRAIWANYWETELTFEKSYLARLSYVHQNAVRHGLVAGASQYPWCSAAWLERTAQPSMVKTLMRLKIDQVRVPDDFDPE
jgi:putative transposase